MGGRGSSSWSHRNKTGAKQESGMTNKQKEELEAMIDEVYYNNHLTVIEKVDKITALRAKYENRKEA